MVNDRTFALIVVAFIVLLLLLIVASQPRPVDVDVFSGVGVDIWPSSIDWGTLSPGDSRNSTLIHVNNTGTRAITLTFNCSGFNPVDAENYMTTTWDYRNQTLAVAEVIDVTFTLTVAANITRITDFRYNVTIYGR